jgi:predicted methyltransferase
MAMVDHRWFELRRVAGALVAVAVLASAPFAAQAQDAGTALDAALAGAHRSEANRARDRYRHPKETLQFFGLRPDMTVVEIWPGGGWYTEVLAPVLRERGKLYVAQYGSSPPFPYQQREMDTLAGKMRAAPDVYRSVTPTALNFFSNELAIAPPGTADLVVTFRNVHNWFQDGYGPPNAAELAFAAMFTALKSGGVLGVVDHRWPTPATENPKADNGYVSEERVIEYAERAGFTLAGRSEVNRNPLDTHDYPQGVWTLPPDLALGDRDRAKYLAIGESDRLTLKFVKPQ